MTPKVNNRVILGIALAVITTLTAGASNLNQVANADSVCNEAKLGV